MTNSMPSDHVFNIEYLNVSWQLKKFCDSRNYIAQTCNTQLDMPIYNVIDRHVKDMIELDLDEEWV